MREKQLEARCRDIARQRGVLLLKLMPTRAGLPDRLLVADSGVLIFIEFKSAMGRLRPMQKRFIAILEGLHHRVRVVRTAQEFEALLDYHS